MNIERHPSGRATHTLLVLLTVVSICTSLFFYFNGLSRTSIFNPQKRYEEKFVQKYIEENDPDYHEELILAQSYWLRYEDVNDNDYWGVNGPMGIWGARDHFLQHGKREGRIFARVYRPDDMALEQHLAQSYWKRYPIIANSQVWGRKSPLGILGPRDHYRYRGRFEGKTWSADK